MNIFLKNKWFFLSIVYLLLTLILFLYFLFYNPGVPASNMTYILLSQILLLSIIFALIIGTVILASIALINFLSISLGRILLLYLLPALFMFIFFAFNSLINVNPNLFYQVLSQYILLSVGFGLITGTVILTGVYFFKKN